MLIVYHTTHHIMCYNFKLKYMTQLWSVRCNLNNIVFDIKGDGYSMVAKLILKVSWALGPKFDSCNGKNSIDYW